MKLFNSNKLFLFLAVFGLFVASCIPDPVDTDGPKLTFETATGFLTDDANIDAGESFKVRLSAQKGSAEMNALTISRDGQTLDASLITIEGISVVNNPQVLTAAARTSFTYDITIKGHDKESAKYTFRVDATDKASSSKSLTITVADSDPVLTLTGPNSIELENPSIIALDVNATPGGGLLKSLAVYEDGNLITDLTRLRFKESTEAFGANPLVLEGDDKNGFSSKIFIKSSSEVGTKKYTFTVTDENDKEASFDYTITIKPIATGFTNTYTDVKVYNNAGTEYGALDLDTGSAISSTQGAADIVDNGIDGDGNWKKELKAKSGVSMRAIAGTYDGISSKELLVAAYTAGTDASIVKVGEGSIFAAKKGDAYYLIQVGTVNETNADNLDYYLFNIKEAK